MLTESSKKIQVKPAATSYRYLKIAFTLNESAFSSISHECLKQWPPLLLRSPCISSHLQFIHFEKATKFEKNNFSTLLKQLGHNWHGHETEHFLFPCPFRECVRAGAGTRRSLGHHLLHPLILRLIVLCAPAVLRLRALQDAPAPADPNS